MMMFRPSDEDDIAAHHQKDFHGGSGSNSGFESSDGYWAKRKKNNEAARRSREKRRLNDMMMEKRMMQLTEENKKLKTQLWTIQIKYGETQESTTYSNPNVQYSNEPPSQVSKPGGFTSKFFTNSCGDTSAKVIIKTPASRAADQGKKHSAAHYQTSTGATTNETNHHHLHMSDHVDKLICNPLTEMNSSSIIPTSPHHPPSPNQDQNNSELTTYQNMMSNPELLQHLHVGNLYSNPFNYQALMNGFIQSASCPDIPAHFVHAAALPSMYPLDLRQPTTTTRGDSDIMTSSLGSSVHESSDTKRRRRSINLHHHQSPTPIQSPHHHHPLRFPYDVINNTPRSNGFRSGSESSVTSPRNSPLSDVISNAGSDESGGSSKGGSESGCHLPLKLRFKRKATDGNGSQ